MKTSFKFLATMFVAATLTFAGCKKDPVSPDPNGDAPTTPAENVFSGTSWVSYAQNDYTSPQGITMSVEVDASLDFFDTVAGSLFMDISVSAPAYNYSNSQSAETEFEYVVSGDTITMTLKDEVDEEGNPYVYVALYDKTANTVTLDMDDPDMVDIMGTSVLVFTPREAQKHQNASLVPVKNKGGKMNWSKVIEQLLRKGLK